jgi:hypothetical protein
VSGRPNLKLEQKMELRRAFRKVPDRQRYRFYREQGKRLGFDYRTIQRAVLG